MSLPEITEALSQASAQDLIALIAAANERLETIRAKHIEEAQLLGLTVKNGSVKKRRKSRGHKEEE